MASVASVMRGLAKTKFIIGEVARKNWKKTLIKEECTVTAFNQQCGNTFIHIADIVLDDNEKRQTTLKVDVKDKKVWKAADEHIYLFVRGDKIMKIGGTRTGMKARWGSYLCGHCVPERKKRNGENFPGKMSVTNAHLYHTIEDDLLNGGSWSFWSWKLPTITVSVNILGVQTNVIAQTYHAYESRCMELFRKITGHIPNLCDNADPSYRKNKKIGL